MGMTGLGLGDLLLERADGLAIVAGGDRRYRRLQRASFVNALGPHVFEELRPDLGLLDQLENGLGLGLINRSSGSVVIIADNDDVEDIAGDIAAQEGVGAADCLHIRFATGGVERRRHKGVFIMAAEQVLQAAADQNTAAVARFIGIR